MPSSVCSENIRSSITGPVLPAMKLPEWRAARDDGHVETKVAMPLKLQRVVDKIPGKRARPQHNATAPSVLDRYVLARRRPIETQRWQWIGAAVALGLNAADESMKRFGSLLPRGGAKIRHHSAPHDTAWKSSSRGIPAEEV